ncbi:MAG: hypothetical protein ILA11_11210 [Butyrivibrio sp.]|nr:hypothetical protein [Butyrivibrio sp.]
MSVPKSKRVYHDYVNADKAYRIYEELMLISYDMPEMFVDLVMKGMVDRSIEAADLLRLAFDNADKDRYFKCHIASAKNIYKLLSGRLNFFLLRPSGTSHESDKRLVYPSKGRLSNVLTLINEILSNLE